MPFVMDGIIEDIIVDEEKIPPILVNYENEETEDSQDVECELFYSNRKKNTVLSLAKNNNIYESYRPSPEQDMTTVLAIRNKSTNKIRLVCAEKWNVNPVETEDETRTQNLPEDEKDYNYLNTSLINAFGSKKLKRKIMLNQAIRIDSNIIKETMERSIENLDVDSMDSSLIEENEYEKKGYLPPCNENAISVQNVYNIYDLIPKELLNKLMKPAESILENGFPENENEYFSELLNSISKPKRKKKCAILLYVKAIVKWLSFRVSESFNVKILEKNAEIPRVIAQHIVDNFTVITNGGRCRPNSIKDKAVIHCIILILLTCNFRICMKSLQKVIPYTYKLSRFSGFAKLIRLKMTSREHYTYELNIPLPEKKPIVFRINKINSTSF